MSAEPQSTPTGDVQNSDSRSAIWQWLGRPVIASLLRRTFLCRLLLLAAALHLAGAAMGVAIFECPLLTVCRIPCPGCGLTRAVQLLLAGEFRNSMRAHIFAPLALLTLVILVAGCMLPLTLRSRCAAHIERYENYSGISQLAFIALWLYWVYRLMCRPDEINLLLQTVSISL